MDWGIVAFYASTLLGIALLIRLILGRLYHTYPYLGLYVFYQVIASAVAWVADYEKALRPYYNDVYAVLVSVGWIFTLLVVFSLLNAMLCKLPGILRLSKIVLRISVGAAILAGLVSAAVELSSSHFFSKNILFGAVTTMERVITTVAFMALLAIVAFVLWFKVEISKNLVVLTVGFLLYFAPKIVLYYLRVLLLPSRWYILGNIDMAMTSICYLAWLLLLSRRGEKAPVRVGMSWDRGQQERLVHDLETINRSLTPGIRRPL